MSCKPSYWPIEPSMSCCTKLPRGPIYGQQDGCHEMLAMAHVLNELPLPMGSSRTTAACKKCHASPRIGPLTPQ